jgi:hypothetical protein
VSDPPTDRMTYPPHVDLVEALFGAGPEVRYVAVARGQDVVLREREGVASASSSESDRYEELLVNPALLTLARQRGEIDCGGLQYLVVRYGNFFQLVIPHAGGHVSVAVEPSADPIAVARAVRRVLDA